MKNLMGIFAVIFAVTLVAFTAPKKSYFTNKFFEFPTSITPTITNVQLESNWVVVEDIGDCSGTLGKACRIEVTSTYYSGSTLLSGANLVATESAANKAYVSGGNTVQRKNQP